MENAKFYSQLYIFSFKPFTLRTDKLGLDLDLELLVVWSTHMTNAHKPFIVGFIDLCLFLNA